MAFDPSTARLYTEAPAAAQKPAGFDPTSARPAPATAAAPAQPGIFNRAVNAAAAKAATIGGALSDAADIVTAPRSTAPTPPPMPAAPSVVPPVASATPSAPVAPAPGTGGIGSEFLQGLEAGAGGQNVSMLGGAMEAGGVLVEDAVPILGRALRSGGQKLQDYGTEVTPTPQVGSIADVPGDGVLDTLNRAGKFAAYSAGSGIGTSLPSLAIGGAAGLATANPMVGFIAGAIGPSYIQNLGDVYTSASSDPEITAAVQSGQVTEEQVAKTAALAAVPIAALDAIGLEKTLGAAFKPAKDALRQRIMRGIATGAISEGSTEGLQNIVSQWAQSTLGQHKDLSDRMIEVVDNVLGGVFAGGLMGGVAGIGDTPTAPRGATNKPGREGEYIPPAPAGTPRLADPNRVIEASAAGQLIPVEGIVNRARAVEPTAPVAPALLTGENGPTTNIDVVEQPNITADAARRPREPLATEAGYTLTEALDEARRNAPPANNIDVQEGVDLTGVRGVEHIEAAYPPDGIEVDESPMPKPPAFEPVGAGQGALPANAPKPADWRAKWDTKEVGPGRWRIVGMANGNPISPAFSSKSDAEVWADNQGAPVTDIDIAAHEAATSPQNDLPEPTEAQKKAGNYKKGHVSFQGNDIAIENPVGSKRSGTDPNGKPWSVDMSAHYGYVKRTTGADGDQVDVYLPDQADESAPVHVFDQYNPDTGEFDEHKAVLGVATREEAERIYDAHFSDGTGPKRRHAVTTMSADEFKQWVREGDTKKPAREAAVNEGTVDIGQVRPETTNDAPSQARDDQASNTQPEVAAEQAETEEGERYPEADAEDWDYEVANFPDPGATVNATKVAGPYVSTDAAAATLANWKAEAKRIGREEDNSNKVIISLFDASGEISKPWKEAGYQVAQYDIKLGDDLLEFFPMGELMEMQEEGFEIVGVIAQPPCTCFSSSGARWWSERHDKHDRDMVEKMFGPNAARYFSKPKEYTRALVSLVDLAIGETNPKFWVVENPVGRIATEMGMPKPTLTFDPHVYGDPYTKRTQLWGKFNADLPTANVEPTQGSLMHKLWSRAEKDGGQRSLTPEGFAYALFMANHPTAAAKPAVSDNAAEQPATAGNSDAPLTVETYTDKSIIVRGDTRAHKDRIKAIGGALWNKKAGGWIFKASKRADVEKGLADLLGKSAEELPLSAPKNVPENPAPEPKRKQPGDADYTLLDARNDLIEYRTQIENQGAAVDDRLAERVRRQEKLVKEMEAAEKPTTDDDLSAMFDDVLAEELSARGQPAALPPAKRGDNIEVVPIGNNDEYILREPSARGDGSAQNLARFTFRNGRISKLKKLFEDSGSLDLIDIGIAQFLEQQRQAQPAKKPQTPQVAPLTGMAPLGARPPAAPQDRTAGESLTSAAKNTAQGLSSAIKGLGELFGGKGGRLNSGLSFDEETYAKAKPLFIQAVRNLKDAASDLREAMRTIIRMVLDQFGAETADGMKPYVVRFVGDVQAGAINLTEGSDDGIQDGLSGVDEAEQPEGVQPPVEDGGTGSAPAGEDGGSVPDAGPTAGGRAARGKRGASGRSGGARGRKAGAGNTDRTPAGNYRIEPGALEESRGPAQKARDNFRAIELARQIDAEGRPATLDEQHELALYVGWGGLSGAFPDGTGAYGKGFETIGPKVRELLNDTEYATAQRSIQYAHYTSEPVIRAMWDAASLLGFKGGKVFEPGMGIGHFAGLMPADIAERTAYTGLELDHTTARIARLLYPKWGVRQDDFTKAPLPENMNDLVIGNPPFADIAIKSDPKYATHSFLLHDYFFAKSLDSVRPGGLLMFISSAGTMNKNDTAARQYLADRADLVGAIRLPSSAFKENAGTEVTTDIIIMRKRLPDEEPAGQPFVDVAKVTLPDKFGNMKDGNISSYFAAHPEMVLGEQGFFDKLYAGRYAVRPTPGAHLPDQLSGAIARLPEDVMSDWTDTHGHDDIDFASEERKEGSYYLDKDGRLMQHAEGVGRPVERRGKGVEGGKSADEIERIKGLIPIRDALRAVYAADLGGDTANADRARERLNKAYDDYVNAFGPINKSNLSYRRPNRIQVESARDEVREEARYSGQMFNEGSFDPSRMIEAGKSLAEIAKARADARETALAAGTLWDEGTFNPDDMPDIVIDKRPNIDPFSDDQESYRLRAIERYDESTGIATKGLVFAESVITKEKKPEINSAGDAMLYVLNKHGYPDIEEIAKAARITRDDVLTQLGNSLFEVPGAPGTYETSEDYLSGNVRVKLAEAQAAARNDDRYRKNVQALLDAQPIDLPPSQISATLGMPWIPAEDIVEFATEALGLEDITVKYVPKLAEWMVTGNLTNAAATATFGTARVPGPKVLHYALNRVPLKVFDSGRNSDGSTYNIFNSTETEGALLKLQEVKDKFAAWIYGDEARADRLAALYNEKYNNLRPWEGDGSYLTTPGVSAEWGWRPHQLRVIARILRMGNTYMGHAVGAGKTSAMIGAAMEMRRLGLVRKPMIAVPNHMLGQFTKEFYEQYPTAKIMVADERRFHTSRRKQFIAEVANQDLDAVIITHSAMGKIPVSNEFQDRIIQEQIDSYREIQDELGKKEWNEETEKRLTRKNVEKAIERLSQRLSGSMKGGRKDQVFTFEEMGIDFLFVDEAHLFRKLDFATRMSGVKGISPKGSQMSMDLYVKARYLRSQNPTRHMVLASGTPITNTMAELYSVSRYIQEDELESRGLAAFDAWAAAFGDTVTEVEQDAAGDYKAQTRFAQFVNVPELSAMVRQAMDVVTSSDLAQYVTRPAIKGGKRKLMLAEKSEALEAYQQELASRMRAIENRKGPPQKGDDILLSVITDGRLAAIDMRLVNPSAGRSGTPSKLDMLVEDVHRVWQETAAQPLHKAGPDGYSEKPTDYGPATQMIFANLGIGDGRPFNVAKYIVSELVSRGVPRAEVALIADYNTHVARQKLFNDMNEGKVRVLIGSTGKMATGVNAQRRLFRINNLDPLWYPADDEQRVGRALRQGNMNPEIEIADYSTKGTYDSQMWSLMAKKARFIEGFFRGDPTMRTMEDLGEASQYEQAKAMTTNDPRLIELTNLKQDLERGIRRRDAFESETYNAKRRVQYAQSNIASANKDIARLEGYIAQRIDTSGENFFGQLGDTLYKDRAEFGKAMWELRKEMAAAKETVKAKKVGEFGGFNLALNVALGEEMVRDAEGQLVSDARGAIKTQKVWGAWLFLQLDKDNTIFARGNGALAQVATLEDALGDFEAAINRDRRAIADGEKDIREFTPRMQAKFEGQAAIDEVFAKLKALENALAEESKAAKLALAAQAEAAAPDEGDPGTKYAARQSTGAPERGLSASGLHDYLARTYGGKAIRNLLRTGKLKIVAANDPSLPQDAKDAMRDGRRIYGLYDEPSDTTFLVHDNLTDAGQRVGDLEDGAAIFLHELGVHYGMPDFLGQDHFNLIKKQLRLAAKANSSELGVAARAAYAQVPASTRIDHIDEEALAWLVTDRANHQLGLVRRILMKIRAWLVKHGFKNVSSPDELVELARGAVKHAAGERLNVARPKAQRFASRSGPFYSKALQAVESAPMAKGTGEQWLAMMKKAGTKQEEIDWLGLPELLNGKAGVTRDDLADHIRANQVEVTETVLDDAYTEDEDIQDVRQRRWNELEMMGDEEFKSLVTDYLGLDVDDEYIADHTDDLIDSIIYEEGLSDASRVGDTERSRETQYANYQTPGGGDYRELLLTLPSDTSKEDRNTAYYRDTTTDYRSSHWNEPNILAHIRFNERTDADGKRVLFVEEIQSDWHQAGRKHGYLKQFPQNVLDAAVRGGMTEEQASADIKHLLEAPLSTPERPTDAQWSRLDTAIDNSGAAINLNNVFHNDDGVPNAPFKQSWPLLAMKRVIRWAAENGFERVAWTTGDMQAERYTLSSQVHRIVVVPRTDARTNEKTRSVQIELNSGRAVDLGVDNAGIVDNGEYKGKPLSDVVGKEMADKLMSSERGTFAADDLRLGGEGMKGFYDKILPAETNKYIKKWGGKVEKLTLGRASYTVRPMSNGYVVLDSGNSTDLFFYTRGLAEERASELNAQNSVAVPSFDVTPAMREAALQGQPLFAQRDVTGTDAFKRWFGDSKAVNEFTGEPLVLYHGTTASFDEFNPNMNPFEPGVFLTPDRAFATFFTQASYGEMARGGNIMPVYARLTNPLVVDFEGMQFPYETGVGDIIARAKKAGHDGVILRDVVEGEAIYPDGEPTPGAGTDQFIVFSPEQVKSATGNRGTFDARNSDIRYAARDVTDTPAFKRWFGDSKVVDESGNPLAVYHGTNANIAQFDTLREENPGERGTFFTASPRAAAEYGSAIYPTYLAIENPYVVTSKQWATSDGLSPNEAREQGYDGYVIRGLDGKGGDAFIAFRPEQIKSATGNRGTFDPNNPSILYAARDPGQPVEDSPALEQSLIQRARQRFEPWLDSFRYEAQDKFHYLKKAQQEAADARELPELPESEDAYLAELRYHGMAGAAIEDFQRDHVDPMLKAIQDAGLDIGRVDEFLHARHAKEANAQLRKINPTADELEERIAEAAETGDFVLAARLANHKPYEGDNTALSGMSNAEAREVMAKARADGKFDALEDVGRRVDEITAARRNLLVASGLEKRGTIAAWENAYEHYVPLKREGKGDALPRRGRGYDTRGKEKRRAGSTRAVEHILANVVAQHEATLMRAEKAKVGRAMMTFAVKNPNPELYEVNKVDYQPSFDAQGLVTYRPEPGMVMADNVFVVRVRGEDHRITFNDANPDAMKIAAAMKNLGAEESGPIINALSKITRLLSLVNTGANPEFIISNFARDIQTAGYNLSGTDADALKWQIIGDVGKAWKGIRAFQKKQGGAWADKFDEFRKAGAQTGWLDHYRDINDREKALVAKVRDMEGGAWPTVKRGLRAIEKFIEDENTAVENAIRLSAFVHARDMGMTEAQAARLAKELTVNFNRRGAMGKTLNALYMFYNASIQGQVRIISAIAKSRKVQGLVVATVIGAALLDMWNRSVGDDDDDKPNPYDSEAMKYVKDRNLVFMLPGGDYVKIPLPWGYNVFHVLGQTMGEMMTKPGAKPTEAAARVAGSIVDAFNPIGGSVSLLQMISPTVVDPIAQWYENKDFAGRPLRPSGNPFGPAKPESQQYWSSVRPYSKWITEQLNTLTGGDEVRPGVVDFSPEAIDLAIDTITGGAGRFVADTVGAPWKRFAQGEKLETYEVPVLRKVYGSAGPAQITQDYYKHRDAVALTSSQLSHYKTDAVKLRDIRQKHAEELRMIPIMKATESQLKKLREMKKLTKDRARQREIEDRMRQVMARFNERYYKVVTRAAD